MLAVSQAPIARSFTMPAARPQISGSGGSTIIRNHEQIATVAGSVSFAAGLSLYAWLSGRARGYEKYRLRRFRAYYVPADTGTTTVGEIYVGFDYDPVDAAPSSLAAMSAYETMPPNECTMVSVSTQACDACLTASNIRRFAVVLSLVIFSCMMLLL
jgi:hypothetical protein